MKGIILTEQLSAYLQPGPTVESEAPSIIDFAKRAAGNAGSQKERAIQLYYVIRDEIRYDPYTSSLDVEGLRATRTLAQQRGYCVSKAILLAATCRALGIPARLGFADVRNHLSTEKMRQRMQTDIFYWHGYTSIYLDGRWVKATPAFNIELCDRFGLKPLEFNGVEDSIYHPHDTSGNRHMEYVNYRGEFVEPPLDQMLETFQREYPRWRHRKAQPQGDFDAEVEQETNSLSA